MPLGHRLMVHKTVQFGAFLALIYAFIKPNTLSFKTMPLFQVKQLECFLVVWLPVSVGALYFEYARSPRQLKGYHALLSFLLEFNL